jgi:putative membrane protein
MNILRWEQEIKIKWAAIIAIIFHAVGLIGILWIDPKGFADMTPMNLLLSVALIFWTQEKINIPFIIFLAVSFCTGLLTEYLGVNYQILFGHYRYETALGPKIGGVPWVIGLNWFMVIYCCGIMIKTILNMIWIKLGYQQISERDNLGFLSIIINGALLAMLFDTLMEPVAIRLGYWTWLTPDGIPAKNYWDWFFVSLFLMVFFRLLRFSKKNQFALHLLLIQVFFFLFLRILL